jgi:hypothetical protein
MIIEGLLSGQRIPLLTHAIELSAPLDVQSERGTFHWAAAATRPALRGSDMTSASSDMTSASLVTSRWASRRSALLLLSSTQASCSPMSTSVDQYAACRAAPARYSPYRMFYAAAEMLK